MAASPVTPPTTGKPLGSDLPIASMICGILSLTGLGLLLGVPAIIMAIVALKKKYNDRGLSIAGLITGVIGTLFSLLMLMFFGAFFIWSSQHPGDYQQRGTPSSIDSSRYESSQT